MTKQSYEGRSPKLDLVAIASPYHAVVSEAHNEPGASEQFQDDTFVGDLAIADKSLQALRTDVDEATT